MTTTQPTMEDEHEETNNKRLRRLERVRFVLEWDQHPNKTFSPWFTHQLVPPGWEDEEEDKQDEEEIRIAFAADWTPRIMQCKNAAIQDHLQSANIVSVLPTTNVATFPPPSLGRLVLETDHFMFYWCENVATHAETTFLVENCQRVAHFFIESASFIDAADRKFHLLTCVTKSQSNEHIELVGFCTVYEFINPMRHANPSSLHICQMVTSPVFQCRGVGTDMIKCVLREASCRDDVFEVTVEDPCEAFTKLRDAIDVQSMRSCNIFFNESWPVLVTLADGITGVLGSHTIDNVRSRLKISSFQIQRGYETACVINLYMPLQKEEKEDQRQEQIKRFRLRVKARLLKKNMEILGQLLNEPVALKKELEDLYQQELAILMRLAANKRR